MKALKDEFSSVRLLLLAFGLLSALILALCLSSRLSLPPLVGRALTDEETRTVISRNSPLTEYVLLSPNATFPREEPITKITVHHMAGDLTLEELGRAERSGEDPTEKAALCLRAVGVVSQVLSDGGRARREQTQRSLEAEVTALERLAALRGDVPGDAGPEV